MPFSQNSFLKNKHTVVRITAVVQKSKNRRLMESLHSIGIDFLHMEPGREPILEEHRGFRAIFTGGDSLTSDPVSVFTMFTPVESEIPILEIISEAADLHIPGMGVLFSEDVELFQPRPICHPGIPDVQGSTEHHFLSDATGIYCLVQRGEGDRIARAVLEGGFAVPTVTFGEGMGLRDRLGLLRITVPAEKEILTLVAASHDTQAAMELMIESGKLDRPGRGYINTFHVRHAILNTRIMRGNKSHAASMEQVVSAIDAMKGNMAWRMRGLDSKHLQHRRFLKNLVEFRLSCDEGAAREIADTAIAAGAGGATINRARFIDTGVDPDMEKVPAAREIISFSVSEDKYDTIIEAMATPELLGSNIHGTLSIHRVPMALTYLKPK